MADVKYTHSNNSKLIWKWNGISKSFHYQLRLSDKQALVGPPESMREHIVAASKAMKTGDWKKCSQNILAVSCWELFPNAEKVKAMIMKKIQEESLRTYLFTYNKVYDSISMYELAEMFDLPWQMVHSIISKMIINEELQASWDQPTQSLVLHHGAEPTYLQSLTLQLSDKLNTLVEHHERILDFKYGPIFQKDKKERGEKGGQNRGQNRGPNANKGQYRNNQRRHHNKQQQQDM
jgi:translation initiation factor 3 subunit C